MYEIIEKRTRNSKHFDLGNGQIQAVIQKGIHYFENFTGTFEDFNGNWIFEKDFGWKVKKADHNLRILDKNPNKKWLRVGLKNGVFVEYNFPNIEPAYNRNSALFSNAWVNTDIRLTSFPEGVKNDIVLKTTGHPSSFSFPIQTTGCTVQFESNSLVFYSSGNIIGKIPAPYMEDANGKIGKVTLDYDGNNVRFVPDSIWLASAVYPITIDPTTTLQPNAAAGKDAALLYRTTDGAYGDSNFGSASVIPIGWDSNIYPNEGVLEFDLSSVPPNSLVTSCVLDLYFYTYTGLQTNTCDIGFKNFSTSWAESTITWNNKPVRRATPLTIFTSFTGTINAMNSFDISNNAQDWLNNGNNGLYIFDQNPYVNDNKKGFKSSDDTTASGRPKLVITYSTGSQYTKTLIANVLITSLILRKINKLFTNNIILNNTIKRQINKLIIVQSKISGIINKLKLLVQKSPIYKWKELLQNYTFQEQKQKYKIKELPSVYSWKELK